MMSIIETVWRTVPWAHAVHYCEGDVLVVLLRERDMLSSKDNEFVQQNVERELGPDVAVKVIVV